VAITPTPSVYKADDVLTCGSGDGFQPSYEWTGNAGGASVDETVNTYTLPEGDFTLTCTVTGTGPDEEECTDTDVASGTAYRKYRNQ